MNKEEQKGNALERYIEAQEKVYQWALAEVKNGKKLSHWIWYIFPQLKGLGESYNSHYYGIDDVEEARAYLQHPVLGARLREITEVFLQSDKSAEEIFGGLDAMKVRSCMTLFDEVADNDLFDKVLKKHYQNKADKKTLQIIELFCISRRKYGWGAIIGCLYAMKLEENKYWENRHSLELQDKRFWNLPHNFITSEVVATIALASNLLYGTDLSAYYGIDNSSSGYLFYSNYCSFPYCNPAHGFALQKSLLGWVYNTIEETIYEVSLRSYDCFTKASQAIAACVFMARKGKSKKEIKDFIEKEFGYDLNKTCADFRLSIATLYDSIDKQREWEQKHFSLLTPTPLPEEFKGNNEQYKEYYFNQYAPEAIVCFLESNNFEDAIQLAVSLNTDSPDTLGGMVGAIAESYYGDIYTNNISVSLYNTIQHLEHELPIELKKTMKRFSLRFGDKQ